METIENITASTARYGVVTPIVSRQLFGIIEHVKNPNKLKANINDN